MGRGFESRLDHEKVQPDHKIGTEKFLFLAKNEKELAINTLKNNLLEWQVTQITNYD